MNSNIPYRVLLQIFSVAALISSGCAGTVQSTASPTVPAATQTLSPKPVFTKTPTPDEVATAQAIETASVKDIVATVRPTVLESHPSIGL